MWHHHPEWVRTCRDCAKWVMKGDGTIQTYGPDETPLPRDGPPPCWVCAKHRPDAEPDTKKPLPPDEDFGGWFGQLQDWYDEGRACGFPADLHGTARQVATVFEQAERGVERAERRQLIQLLIKRAQQ